MQERKSPSLLLQLPFQSLTLHRLDSAKATAHHNNTMSSNQPQHGGAASSSAEMINPHNPDFITKKPWYIRQSDGAGEDGPTIEHQKTLDKKVDTSLEASERALEVQRNLERQRLISGKFHKGQWVEALYKNHAPYRMCQIVAVYDTKSGSVPKFDLRYEDGTMERQVKQTAMGRPRIRMTKSGSRAEGTASAAESFDSKRDRYHGYDKDTHNAKLLEKYEEREKIRSQLREEQQQSEINNKDSKAGGGSNDDEGVGKGDADDDDDDDSDEDEFLQTDEQDKVVTTRLARQGGVGGAQMKVTARNLRIREDTAKYLRNLNLESAYYDPKSRSMRDNPNPEVPLQAAEFAGDNFTRISGDAVGLAETQLFAWEAANQGADLHMQANPSLAEKARKEFKSKASELQIQRKKAVLDKYGGQEHLDGSSGLASAVDSATPKPIVDRRLRFGVSTVLEDHRQEQSTSAKSDKKQVPLESQYEEDIFINGHTTVWGSYFHKGAFQWGYADDHSLLKNSYCTGENGRIANDESNEMRFGSGKAGSAALAQARGMLKARPGGGAAAAPPSASRSKLYGEADRSRDFEADKVKAALDKAADQELDGNAPHKRKYHSMEADVQLTEEDMEAYRLRKERRSDPMAHLSSEEVLPYSST